MKYEILQGNCLDLLSTLEANSVDCVVTSPPYYGLRDYGVPPTIWGGTPNCNHQWNENFCACGAWLGCLGAEPTPELYVTHMVAIFHELRRVLKPTGTCWINLGDSYAGSNNGSGTKKETHIYKGQKPGMGEGLKPKDLMGIPWMVAFALRADGWWLRNEIIWHKPNIRPESMTDRLTRDHETVFLLTKEAHYFFDVDAIREPYTRPLNRWGGDNLVPKSKSLWDEGTGQKTYRKRNMRPDPAGRRKRTVWSINTRAYKEAHYATMPMKLAEYCIKAGCSEHGVCGACGNPYERLVERLVTEPLKDMPYCGDGQLKSGGKQGTDGTQNSTLGQQHKVIRQTVGWQPTCECRANVMPATVIDPFSGSGTTGAVALQLERDFIGIELNSVYVDLSHRRIGKEILPLFNLTCSS